MKRYGNLYPAICDPDNIRIAFKSASKGKSNYKDVIRIKDDPDKYLTKIEDMLRDKTFVNSSYKSFRRRESGKVRHIHKLPFFPDRIVQHAVCQVLSPIWDRQYIRDTYSCIVGRGIHDGVKRVKKALREDPENTVYCLKFDIKKYYPSISNEILKDILRRKIKCKDTLWILDSIVDSTKGIPIGNYTSQHFSNLYLSGFDHWVKEKLRVRYYYRYCDDIVLLSNSKEKLRSWFLEIKSYLNNHLLLTIKDNWQVFPVSSRGIDFLGYRFFHTHTLLRKGIVKRYKKRVKELKKHENINKSRRAMSSLASYQGWMKYANCYNLRMKHKI